MNDVLIIDTGVANLRSMEAALEREDFPTRRTRDAEAIATAERVVLPGVGSFARGLDNLGTDCAAALKKRVTGGLPTLAVCLGMQMLAECSEEDPGRRGLGLLPGAVQRLTAVALDAGTADLLEVAPGAPALLITRIGYTAADRAVELTQSTFRGDRWDFVTELS